MATSYTYPTLKAAILSFTEDYGSEFDAAIDTIIPLAEDRVLRDLDLELFDVIESLAFTPGNPLLTKPTGLVALRTLHFTDATGNFVLLEPRSWAFIKDYWPKVATTTATPRYFAEYSSTEWFMGGTPSLASVVTPRYIKRPAGLTALNPTTWLSANVGDLLLMACLIGSEQYLKADERIGVWKQDYVERLSGARMELKGEDRVDYMPLTAIPAKE